MRVLPNLVEALKWPPERGTMRRAYRLLPLKSVPVIIVAQLPSQHTAGGWAFQQLSANISSRSSGHLYPWLQFIM